LEGVGTYLSSSDELSDPELSSASISFAAEKRDEGLGASFSSLSDSSPEDLPAPDVGISSSDIESPVVNLRRLVRSERKEKTMQHVRTIFQMLPAMNEENMIAK
jgi:hypothetical protein